MVKRELFLCAAAVSGLWVVLTTELLSLPGWLTSGAVGISWVLFAAVLVYFWYAGRVSGFRGVTASNGFFERGLAGFLVVFAAALFVQGFCSAPNSFDAMTYHLSRVMHWAQNRSVEFYPTAIERQLWMPPLAEYFILHLYFLTGSDRLAFLPQWGAYIGCIMAASLTARNLGGNRIVQMAAAGLCAGVPIAVLQAVSTQNDLFASFWLMSAVAWLTKIFKMPDSRGYAVLFAVSAALALLAKMTMAIFLFPFFVMGGVWVWRKSGKKAFVFLTGITVFIVLIVSAPHWLRTWSCFGAVVPKGEIKELRLLNEAWTLEGFVSNFLKGAALELGTPAGRMNQLVKKCFDHVPSWTGVASDDARYHFEPRSDVLRKEHFFSEGRAANPLHFLLMCVVLGLMWRQRRLLSGPVLCYGACVLAGFLLLTLIVKWQAWMPRFHMSVFLLAAPLTALVFASLQRTGLFLKILVGVVMAAAAFSMIFNVSHPFVGENAFYRITREEQYFLGARPEKPFFDQAVQAVLAGGCFSIGLRLAHEDAWEYPLWPMLRARGVWPTIRHVDVGGMSGNLDDATGALCMTLDLRSHNP